MTTAKCHICQGPLEDIPDYAYLPRVTSDCRPWPPGGGLGACRTCGTVQKVVCADWVEETRQIYSTYAMYRAGSGKEQAVFDVQTGMPSSRSRALLEQVAKVVGLKEGGRLLDIGCGNGSFLRVFGQYRPGWSLCGTEFDDRHRADVEALPGVERLYCCPPSEVPGTFDVITLVHVLEHLVDPVPFLAQIRSKLNPDGLLLIESPNLRENPFDLCIADHASHFDRDSLSSVLAAAGYRVIAGHSDWIAKELSFLAAPAPQERHWLPSDAKANAVRWVSWLASLREQAEALAAEGGPWGIMGTSIAAAWVSGGCQPDFYVDEDPIRVGGRWMERPVIAPDAVAPGARVFIPLVPAIAQGVVQRLERHGVACVVSQPYPSAE